MKRHIILIGFKSVGKSAVGKELAKQIGRTFADLDENLQHLFAGKNGESLTPRQIMLKIGRPAFRKLECDALKQALRNPVPSVVSLGGGTPTHKPSQVLILPHIVVQITAPKNIVYERIMVNGRPAFFSPDEHPLKSFNRIWAEREKIYNKLTSRKVDNSTTVAEAVKKIKKII